MAILLTPSCPQNVLLGEDGVLKIGDLGISQRLDRIFACKPVRLASPRGAKLSELCLMTTYLITAR